MLQLANKIRINNSESMTQKKSLLLKFKTLVTEKSFRNKCSTLESKLKVGWKCYLSKTASLNSLIAIDFELILFEMLGDRSKDHLRESYFWTKKEIIYFLS